MAPEQSNCPHATPAGTAAYAARHPELGAARHFRSLRLAEALQTSSLGFGTYLGEADEATDAAYAGALREALAGGINLVDTAINYRHQRSERVIGRVLAEGAVAREQVIICTKAGFIPFEGDMPEDPRRYFQETFLRPGIIQPGQVAGGSHCMAPVFLAHQIERSLQNLGLACVDVFYLHNPETQQSELSREEFHRRIRAAFEMLEKQAGQGRIRYYGIATWSGLRVPPDSHEFLDLQRMVGIARELAGEGHRFRFVQLPYNLAMPEAATLLNQTVDKPPFVSSLNAAVRLGLNVVASASLMQGRLAELPADSRDYLKDFLPAMETDAGMALQFVRSTSTVSVGLAGMAQAEHVRANLKAAAVAPAAPSQISKLLGN